MVDTPSMPRPLCPQATSRSHTRGERGVTGFQVPRPACVGEGFRERGFYTEKPKSRKQRGRLTAPGVISAGGQGFEPWSRLPEKLLSRQPQSSTLASPQSVVNRQSRAEAVRFELTWDFSPISFSRRAH